MKVIVNPEQYRPELVDAVADQAIGAARRTGMAPHELFSVGQSLVATAIGNTCKVDSPIAWELVKDMIAHLTSTADALRGATSPEDVRARLKVKVAADNAETFKLVTERAATKGTPH